MLLYLNLLHGTPREQLRWRRYVARRARFTTSSLLLALLLQGVPRAAALAPLRRPQGSAAEKQKNSARRRQGGVQRARSSLRHTLYM